MSYVGAAAMSKDFTQGPAINTGNKLDLMIEGEGMFAVNTDEGTRYMRSGDMTLNRDGALVSKMVIQFKEKKVLFISGEMTLR